MRSYPPASRDKPRACFFRAERGKNTGRPKRFKNRRKLHRSHSGKPSPRLSPWGGFFYAGASLRLRKPPASEFPLGFSKK